MPQMHKQFVFICGCARSGTSVTTELIRKHPQIVLGKERFNTLFKNNKNDFNPTLFTSERFCKNLMAGDTHHKQLGGYYDQSYKRWNKSLLIGDKIPSLFNEFDYLMTAFDQPKFFFLLRNIFDVSHSWEQRRLQSIKTEGKWPQDRGFLEAIEEWNTSLYNVLNVIKKNPQNFFVIPYHQLFTNKSLLTNLFNFLNLDPTIKSIRYWNESAKKKNRLEKNRTIHMPSSVKNAICLHADFNSFRQLTDIAVS